jgi:riboflavin transporter FmnP
MTRIGVLAAVAIVLFLPGLEIPVVAFYKLDLSSFPAILAGLSMGPLAGFLVVLIKNLIHLPLFSTTAGVGELADVLMSSAFVLPAAFLYARNKSMRTAVMGLGIGIVCIAVAGMLVNYFIMLPAYMALMNLPKEAILGMARVDSFEKLVLYITLPFNLLKGTVLSVVTLLVYKRLSPLLH